jgi:hypothetical protein
MYFEGLDDTKTYILLLERSSTSTGAVEFIQVTQGTPATTGFVAYTGTTPTTAIAPVTGYDLGYFIQTHDQDTEMKWRTVTSVNNTLVTREKFKLLGADGETEMELDVIVQDHVPVTIDNRNNAWFAESDDGMIYWYDPDGDGFYQVGFVFTSETKYELSDEVDAQGNRLACPAAAGYFIDTNGNMRFDFRGGSPDIFYPTWWLSNLAGVSRLRGFAYDEVDAQYKAIQSDWAYIVALAIDLAMNVVFLALDIYLTEGSGVLYMFLSLLWSTFASPAIHKAIWEGVHGVPERPNYYLRQYAPSLDSPYPHTVAPTIGLELLQLAMPRMVFEIVSEYAYSGQTFNEQLYGSLEGWAEILDGLGIYENSDFMEGNPLYWVFTWWGFGEGKFYDLAEAWDSTTYVPKPKYLRHVMHGWYANHELDIASTVAAQQDGPGFMMPIVDTKGKVFTGWFSGGEGAEAILVNSTMPAEARYYFGRFPQGSNAYTGDSCDDPSQFWVDPFTYYTDLRMPLPIDVGYQLSYETTCLSSCYQTAYADAWTYSYDIIWAGYYEQLIVTAIQIAMNMGVSAGMTGQQMTGGQFASQFAKQLITELFIEEFISQAVEFFYFHIIDQDNSVERDALADPVVTNPEYLMYSAVVALGQVACEYLGDKAVDALASYVHQFKLSIMTHNIISLTRQGKLNVRNLLSYWGRVDQEIARHNSDSLEDYLEEKTAYMIKVQDRAAELGLYNLLAMSRAPALFQTNVLRECGMVVKARESIGETVFFRHVRMAPSKVDAMNFLFDSVAQSHARMAMWALAMKYKSAESIRERLLEDPNAIKNELIAALRANGDLPTGATVDFYLVLRSGAIIEVDWANLFEQVADDDVVSFVFNDPAQAGTSHFKGGRVNAVENPAADNLHPGSWREYQLTRPDVKDKQGPTRIKANRQQKIAYIRDTFQFAAGAGDVSQQDALLRAMDRLIGGDYYHYQVPWQTIKTAIKQLLRAKTATIALVPGSSVQMQVYEMVGNTWTCPFTRRVYTITSLFGSDDGTDGRVSLRNLLNWYNLDIAPHADLDANTGILSLLEPLKREQFEPAYDYNNPHDVYQHCQALELAQRFDGNVVFTRGVLLNQYLDQFSCVSRVLELLSIDMFNKIDYKQIAEWKSTLTRAIQRIADDDLSGKELPRSFAANPWFLKLDQINVLLDFAGEDGMFLKGFVGEVDVTQYNPDGSLKGLKEVGVDINGNKLYEGDITSPIWAYALKNGGATHGDLVHVKGRYDEALGEWIYDVMQGKEVKTIVGTTAMVFPGGVLNSMFKSIGGMAMNGENNLRHGYAYPHISMSMLVPSDLMSNPVVFGNNRAWTNFYRILFTPMTVMNNPYTYYSPYPRRGMSAASDRTRLATLLGGRMADNDQSISKLVFASVDASGHQWGLWRIHGEDNLFIQFMAIPKPGAQDANQIAQFYVRVGRLDLNSIDLDDKSFLDSIRMSVGPNIDVPKKFVMTPRMEGYFHLEPQKERTIQDYMAFFAQRNQLITAGDVYMKYSKYFGKQRKSQRAHGQLRDFFSPGAMVYSTHASGSGPTEMSINIHNSLARAAGRILIAAHDRMDQVSTDEIQAFRTLASHLLGLAFSKPRNPINRARAEVADPWIRYDDPGDFPRGMFYEVGQYIQYVGGDKKLPAKATSRDTLFIQLLGNLGMLTPDTHPYLRGSNPSEASLPQNQRSDYVGEFSKIWWLTSSGRVYALTIPLLTESWVKVFQEYLLGDGDQTRPGLLHLIKKMYPVDEGVWASVLQDVQTFLSWMRSMIANPTSEWRTTATGDTDSQLYLLEATDTDTQNNYRPLSQLGEEIMEQMSDFLLKLFDQGVPTFSMDLERADDGRAASDRYDDETLGILLLKAYYGNFLKKSKTRWAWDEAIISIIQNLGGYSVLDDIEFLAQINRGLAISRHKFVGNWLYAELIRPDFPQWRMLVRINTNSLDAVRSGVQVFYTPGLGPTAFFEDIPADADNPISSQRVNYENWIAQLIANGKLTPKTADLWALLSGASNPTGRN